MLRAVPLAARNLVQSSTLRVHCNRAVLCLQCNTNASSLRCLHKTPHTKLAHVSLAAFSNLSRSPYGTGKFSSGKPLEKWKADKKRTRSTSRQDAQDVYPGQPVAWLSMDTLTLQRFSGVQGVSQKQCQGQRSTIPLHVVTHGRHIVSVCIVA